MKIEQDFIFGQTGWQLAFAVLFGEIGICSSSDIADGTAEQVMEPDSDTAAEKASALISAGFKAPGGGGVDAFFVSRQIGIGVAKGMQIGTASECLAGLGTVFFAGMMNQGDGRMIGSSIFDN